MKKGTDAMLLFVGLCLGVSSCSTPSPRERIEARGLEFTEEALISQAAEGQAEVVKLFVEGGIDVDARDANQMTALMHAAEKRHASVAAVLVEGGAKLNLEDRLGQTALDYASEDPTTGIFADLAARGALYGKLKRGQGAEASAPDDHDH